jgi:hypothetical protein
MPITTLNGNVTPKLNVRYIDGFASGTAIRITGGTAI